jgi:hypothetical protein
MSDCWLPDQNKQLPFYPKRWCSTSQTDGYLSPRTPPARGCLTSVGAFDYLEEDDSAGAEDEEEEFDDEIDVEEGAVDG